MDVVHLAQKPLHAAQQLQRGLVDAVAFGREREAYDQIWPTDIRKALSVRVLNEEPSIRQHLISAVCDRLTAAGDTVTPAALDLAFNEELADIVGPVSTRPGRPAP